MKPDTLRAMAVFVEVARSGSFTRAGASLDLPKSTVSRRIVELEGDIGLKLLTRTTRRVKLTDEGVAYFEHCRRILEDADVAHEEASASLRSVRGHLRVASTADFGLRLVGNLPELCRQHPELTIEFDFTSRRVDPLSESCDVAIYIGVPPDSNLTARKLADVPRHLYASPHYLAGRGEPRSPQELKRHECIREARFDGKGIERHWILSRGRQRVEVEVRGRLSMNNIGMIRRLAAQGMGIASLPEGHGREEVASGALVPVLEDWIGPSLPIFALTATRLLPAKTRAFLEFVQRQF